MKNESQERSKQIRISSAISQINSITGSYNRELRKELNKLDTADLENKKNEIIDNTKGKLQNLISEKIKTKENIFNEEEVKFFEDIINRISNNLVKISENPKEVSTFIKQIKEARDNREPEAKIPETTLQPSQAPTQEETMQQEQDNREPEAKIPETTLQPSQAPTQEETMQQEQKNNLSQAAQIREASTNPIIRALEDMVIAFAKCMDSINKWMERKKEDKRHNRVQAGNIRAHKEGMKDIDQKILKGEKERLGKETELSEKYIVGSGSSQDEALSKIKTDTEKLKEEKSEKIKEMKKKFEKEGEVHKDNRSLIEKRDRHADHLKKRFGRNNEGQGGGRDR